MFFKKKKETDVDVLQKIKDKIVEDEKKNSSGGQKNAIAEVIDDELVADDGEGKDKQEADVAEIGRSVLESMSQIVDKAIQDNNDKQNQFENSLESDFLNDVFAIADAKADEVMNANSNNDSEETDTGADTNATNTEDDEDDDVGSFNFDDELDDDDLNKDEDALLDDDNATEEIDTLVISGDGTDDKEKYTYKQEQKMLTEDDQKTNALMENKNEKNNNQVVQKADKQEETQSATENDEDALLDDYNAIEEIDTLVISGGDDAEEENMQTSQFVKKEIKATDTGDITSSVGNIVEKHAEPANKAGKTYNKTTTGVKEENIIFPNVPKMAKNDNMEQKNVASGDAREEDVLNNDEALSIKNSDNDLRVDAQNRERQTMASGVSQQTQNGVKTSITDLIENVKNQIMQNNRSMASRGSRADGSKTMEQFVADLVQPQIVRYLDGNLERIVNNIVQKEIKKIIDEVEGE